MKPNLIAAIARRLRPLAGRMPATAGRMPALPFRVIRHSSFVILALCASAPAAQVQLKDLTATASVASTDIVGVQINVGGTWHDRKITIGNLESWANLTGTPTSLGGYGITDAQPLSPTLSIIAASSISGTGNVVFSNSPSMVTPTIGVAAATSINGLTITPTTGALAIANGKTLSASNTVTIAGTDGSTLNIGAGGTLGTAAFTPSGAYLPSSFTGNTNIVIVGAIGTGTWQGTSIGIGYGGTGATTASAARTNLGLAIGTDVQAFNSTLSTLSGKSTTGSGSIALSTSPVLTTPTLGAATATSINGLTVTISSGTLTVSNGKTLTASNTLTFSGTDGSALNVGTGGTLGGAAFKSIGASSSDVAAGNRSIPGGGSTGQVLTKINPGDYQVQWSGVAGAGGGAISTPQVGYVETTGNDGTGVLADPAHPFATAQAAHDAGAKLLELGVGSFGDIVTNDDPNLVLCGRGKSLTMIGTVRNATPGGAIYLSGNGLVAVDTVASDGGSITLDGLETANVRTYPLATAGMGTNGMNGGAIRVDECTGITTVVTYGSNGGPGTPAVFSMDFGNTAGNGGDLNINYPANNAVYVVHFSPGDQSSIPSFSFSSGNASDWSASATGTVITFTSAAGVRVDSLTNGPIDVSPNLVSGGGATDGGAGGAVLMRRCSLAAGFAPSQAGGLGRGGGADGVAGQLTIHSSLAADDLPGGAIVRGTVANGTFIDSQN